MQASVIILHPHSLRPFLIANIVFDYSLTNSRHPFLVRMFPSTEKLGSISIHMGILIYPHICTFNTLL
jgi:hypothetical protein